MRIRGRFLRFYMKRVFQTCTYALSRRVRLTRLHTKEIEMLPETMFLMEKMSRTEVLRRQGGSDDEWETWPSSAMDRLAVFLFHLPLSLRHYIRAKWGIS
jgi:hypothetical protein